MKRNTLILILILVIAVIGGGAWWWMNRDTITFPWQAATTNTSNANQTVNTPNLNTVLANVATEVKGNIAAAGTFAVSGVTVKVNSLQTYDQFNGVKAASKKKILVVYIDQVITTDVSRVSGGIIDQTSVTVASETIPVGQFKVAGTQLGGDRGWLSFHIPEGATSATLVVGTGSSATSIPLTIKQ